MASVIEMPKLSDTMEEGGVANWLVQVGEFVEEAGPLLEIETDKATMEYQSPEEGTILKIIVPAGGTCPLSAPICIIGEKGESFDEAALLKPYAAGAAAPAAEAPEAAAVEAPAPVAAEAPAPVAAEAPAPAVSAPAAGGQVLPMGGRHKSSPLARKVAQEKGLNIAAIAGSGPAGRVILRDVESAAAGAPAAVAQAPAAAAAAPAVAVAAAGIGDQDIPVTMMRKTIAKRLLAGKNEAPHFYLTVSADMTKLLAWRKILNDEAAQNDKIKRVSVNDLLIMASAKALIRHPDVNSSWQGTTIRRHGSVHVAVAVALPEGLLTPVVRNTDRLGVREISVEAKRLIGMAKNGSITPDDYTGGTFTISNLGMMGVEEFTAIINPPQAAILAVGATIKTPWVKDDEVVVCPRMKMTLSCDHRVVDGATGAAFLQTLVSFLEDPLMILV
jgi:pyruvate dehydrogenase E2 component (dihydrolipoamide acetyltransferase)